jgi:hypothetical protein
MKSDFRLLSNGSMSMLSGTVRVPMTRLDADAIAYENPWDGA